MSQDWETSPEQTARDAEILDRLIPLKAARGALDRARGPGGREVLAAEADMYSEVGRRVFLLAVAGEHLVQAADIWLAPGDLADLCQGPDAASPAQCNAGFADRWNHAWCTQAGRLRLWNPGHLVLEATTGAVRLPPGWFHREKTVPASDLHHIHGWLGDDWVKRGISLVPREGEPLVIVTRREVAALLDPTYDALDLLCDAAWIRELALGLGEVLILPVELDKDL